MSIKDLERELLDVQRQLAEARGAVAQRDERVADLEAALAKLGAPPPPQRSDMPTTALLDELLRVVLYVYPQLRPHNSRDYEAQFRNAFLALRHMHRARNGLRDVSPRKNDCRLNKYWFLARVEDILKQLRVPDTSMTLGPLMAAVVAQNDIDYAPLSRFPFDLGFGITDGGIPATEAWRELLTTHKVRTPVALPHIFEPQGGGRTIEINIPTLLRAEGGY